MYKFNKQYAEKGKITLFILLKLIKIILRAVRTG